MSEKRGLLTFAFCAAASTASAQEITIKDFALGGDLRGEAARAGVTCSQVIKGSALLSCIADRRDRHDLVRTIAGVEATAAFLSGFDNKLGSIRYTFSQSKFLIVRDALREKYPDLRCVDSTVQNRMGASFDQTICTYETETAKLQLKRRGSDLSEGSVEATTKQYLADVVIDHKRRASEGKKDI